MLPELGEEEEDKATGSLALDLGYLPIGHISTGALLFLITIFLFLWRGFKGNEYAGNCCSQCDNRQQQQQPAPERDENCIDIERNTDFPAELRCMKNIQVCAHLFARLFSKNVSSRGIRCCFLIRLGLHFGFLITRWVCKSMKREGTFSGHCYLWLSAEFVGLFSESWNAKILFFFFSL